MCELAVFPATVQGDTAPASICDGIRAAQVAGCCLVIVGRGGGSLEDLSCFNAESVVRAVYDCAIPVISAVGHETDFTLCDFAADLRAPTPSAAAELAAPDISALLDGLELMRERAKKGMDTIFDRKVEQLSALTQRLDYLSPVQKLDRMSQAIDVLSSGLDASMEKYISRAEENLSGYAMLLESLSPLKVFARGYCAAYTGGRLISSAEGISVGDSVEIRLSDGKIRSTVDFVEKM